ncbi:ABC transporter ATP-binding protein [Corynebacterium cystitidis]|uniref:ABC transporter ATP-binding protein n=1 Tax=Corynebacterium cystitidis TaxID=35757 RepID=UPI00211E3C68|nr:ATP-binding cassette domain-containing protein [Corynebacterium cystitidis]
MPSLPHASELVAVHNVSIARHDNAAPHPDDVSFTVQQGDRVLLLGPSGCGKSTLALALTGLIPHIVDAQLTGTVTLAGVATTRRELHEITEHVAIVFQDPLAQLFTESVFDEVCFALENRCLPVDKIIARATQALNDMDLLWARERPVTQLSGGEQQRLAVACTLASHPALLVLDEPTANLDPLARRKLYDTMATLPPTAAPTILLIEHNIDDALRIVNRVIVLNERGRVVHSGTPHEVFRGATDDLRCLGARLPFATHTHNTLRTLGLVEPTAPIPITLDDLTATLERIEHQGYTFAAATHSTKPACEPVAESAVVVRNLTVRRGEQYALQDVSLEIPRGSISAIIGTSGAGKTTLLHALAGLTSPEQGDMYVNGHRIQPRGASRIGLVFQNPEHQFVKHTVREELTAAAHPHSDRRTLVQRVDAELKRLGLATLAGQHPTTCLVGKSAGCRWPWRRWAATTSSPLMNPLSAKTKQ